MGQGDLLVGLYSKPLGKDIKSRGLIEQQAPKIRGQGAHCR